MATACSSISNAFSRSSECASASGVKNLWIGNYSYSTVWGKNAQGIVTGATAAPTFYQVDLREGTCAWTEELVVNAQFGNRNIRENFELVVIGQGQSGRTFLNTVLQSRMVLGVELEDGSIILAGETRPLEVNGGAGASAGVQAGEENTIRVVISGLANAFAPTIDSTYAGTILT